MIKKPVVKLIYNNCDVSEDFSLYISNLSFSEAEESESDELSITLINNDGLFTDQWQPVKGDKLTVSIEYGEDFFALGSFTINELVFNFQPSGDTVEIRALATSILNSVRTEKIKNFSGKTLKQIAEKIARNHNLTLLGEIKEIKTNGIVQKNENDLSFLKRISRLYGYIFNIKGEFLTFLPTDELENKEPLFELSKTSDISNLSLVDSLNKVYGSCRVQYLDCNSKKIMTHTVTLGNDSSDTLYLYKRCGSLEEAKQLALSALRDSKHEINGRLSLSAPNSNFMAGVNGNIIGIGRLEGEFHVKTMQIRVDDGGIKQSGEISRIGDIKNA